MTDRGLGPELHTPPVYACAAGAVLHGHAGDTLEPAVILHTFLPPGSADALEGPGARVDVSGDGPGAQTLTVRVLAEGRSLSWQLPLAPFVAALPGQPGDTGRMVLLAIVDAEPTPSFWARPVDCEQVAAELQLPVADLADALHGRLTPWLADDLAGLLHDDAHDRALDRSPAQTLADAVLAHYRNDLDASQATTALVRAVELAPESYAVELAGRLCEGLVNALALSSPEDRATVLEQTGPFETDALRLLTDLPEQLEQSDAAKRSEVLTSALLDVGDRDDTFRAAVSVIARLARQMFGPDLDDQQVLRRLGMLDDAALARLAQLWVRLATAVSGGTEPDLDELAERTCAEGLPGMAWLRETSAVLAGTAVEVAPRASDRLAAELHEVRLLLDRDLEVDRDVARTALTASLSLARFLRARAGVGPGRWLRTPVPATATAVLQAFAEGLDGDVVVDLLDELLEDDVEGVDVLDGLVCATAQLLVAVDPRPDDPLRRTQVAELLQRVPAGPRGARWLLAAVLREAPHHDPGAADLSPFLPPDTGGDADRAASRAGRTGTLRAGLSTLDALAAEFGEEAQLPREVLLAFVFPTALADHELLRAG